MSLPHIFAAKARALIDRGAVLVDIRELDEHMRLRIGQARHQPLSRLGQFDPGQRASAVIFHCRTGNRTAVNADRLAGSVRCEAFILDGGIDAWKNAGLPVIEDKKQPIEMMRQVQIVAGSLVVAGTALGFCSIPAFTLYQHSSVPGWCLPGYPGPA
jgi:rhodanese-related sulfurtransferase